MNNYHIYEEVGRGKYSVVYKGRIKKSIKYVAVKSVERTRRRKLMNEVRIFHDLNHKNVLKFYNWYETRNHLWIIFEYCAGGDLYSLIEQDKKLPEDTVRKFGFELVEGLSYLHSNGIIYADLKPSNILLNEYGVLKYADFGLSKKISDYNGTQDSQALAQGSQGETGKGKAGTPYYMAPELFHDQGVHSFYSDFWSLGCILFELAAGKPPFSSNSLKDLIAMIVEGESPLPVEGTSQDFNDLLRRMLEKDPIKRINWDEIREHPFWVNGGLEVTRRVYPQQTQFEAYLTRRGINPDHFYKQRSNPLVRMLGQSTGGQGKVDILRLSHNVRRNIKREQEEDDQSGVSNPSQYSGAGSSTTSTTSGNNSHQHYLQKQSSSSSGLIAGGPITNARMVLNFGERPEEEESPQHIYPPPAQYSQPANEAIPINSKQSNSATLTPVYQQQPNSTQVNNFFADLPKPQSTGVSPTTYTPEQEAAQTFQAAIMGKTYQQQSDTPLIIPTLQQQQQQLQTTTPHIPSSIQSMIPQNTINKGAKSQRAPINAHAPIIEGLKQPVPQPITTTNVKTSDFILSPPLSQQQQYQPQENNDPMDFFGDKKRQQQQQQQVARNNQNQIFSKTTNTPQMINQQPPKATTSNTIGSQQSSSQKDLMMLINQQVFSQTASNALSPQGKSGLMMNQGMNSDGQKPQQQIKTIDQLLMHNSDTAVKPIIGNKEIEKNSADQFSSPIFDPQTHPLPFVPWSPDQVLAKIDSSHIEPHLNELYTAISSPQTSVTDKINSLLYFESIIVNSQVSNRLINSAFMNLLVKMLKTVKTPQIRVRVCSVIGLLIRHSTVIENDVAESEVCAQLVEVLMRDKNEKVKRKAVAALGEFMFYAATQLDDEQADPCWEIRDDSINAIIKSLRVETSPQGETSDETVVFYAVKTLENITAQSNSAGGRFATVESANYLLQIFLGIHTPSAQQIPLFQNENLRTSAAVALSHICRLHPKLFPLIFNKITPRLFCYTLTEGSPRVQQAFITVLNQALAQNIYPKINEILLRLLDTPQHQQTTTSGKSSSSLLEDGQESDLAHQAVSGYGFLSCLMRLIEHHSIVIRGKSLLTFLLLFKQDFRWMAIVDPEVKFFHVLDRLSRENYKYVQCCLLCLIEGIVDIIPLIFSAISEELNILLNGGRNASLPSEFDRRINTRSEFETLQLGGNNMIYIAIILDLMQAQCVKARIVNYGFIKSIATLIDNCQCSTQEVQSFQGAEEFLNALLLIVESISSNQKLLLSLADPIIQVMLPVLLSKTKGSESLPTTASADIRFLSLKIFTDIVIQYMNDDSVYDPTKDGEVISQTAEGNTTRQLSDLLQTQVFPRLLCLLQDADPVPLFALKLLSAIVERNPPLFARQMRKQDPLLLPLIAENYQVGHPRLNRHTINILKSVIQSKELSLQEVQHYRLGEKTYMLLKSTTLKQASSPQNQMGDWCTEILLEVLQLILQALMDVVKAKENEVVKLIEDVLNCFDMCVSLLSTTGDAGVIVERASQCLILMLQLYATCQGQQQRKREIYFTETHLQHLINALKSLTPLTSNSPAQLDRKVIVKRILKCIYWALIQSEYQVRLKADKRVILSQIILQLINTSDDRSILNTSKEIDKLLKEQYPMMIQQQQQQQEIMGGYSSSGAIGSMMTTAGQGSGSYQQQLNFYK